MGNEEVDNEDRDEGKIIETLKNNNESDSLDVTVLGEDVIEEVDKSAGNKNYFSFFASAESIEMIENYERTPVYLEDNIITYCENGKAMLTEILPEKSEEP